MKIRWKVDINEKKTLEYEIKPGVWEEVPTVYQKLKYGVIEIIDEDEL